MQSNDLLERIRKLDEAATAGPWLQVKDHRLLTISSDELLEDPHGLPAFVVEAADAEFIAEARTALPRLAAALKNVLDVLDDYTVPGKLHDPTGYTGAELESLEGYIRDAITAAVGDDDE